MFVPARIALTTLACAAIGSSTATALAADEGANSPSQLVADARAHLAKTRSMHLRGYLGNKDAPLRLAGDFTASTYSMTVTIGTARATSRGVKSKTYLRANRNYWKLAGVSTAAARKASDRWVRMPGAGDTGLSPRSIARCLGRILGTLTKTTETINGQRVIVITDAGDKPGSAPTRFYIAADGERRFVRVNQTESVRPGGTPLRGCGTGPDDDVPGDLHFSRFGKRVEVAVPKNAIDVRGLTSPATPKVL